MDNHMIQNSKIKKNLSPYLCPIAIIFLFPRRNSFTKFVSFRDMLYTYTNNCIVRPL